MTAEILKDLARKHDLALTLHYIDADDKWSAFFDGVMFKKAKGKKLQNKSGYASEPNAALEDFANQIAGMTMVINPHPKPEIPVSIPKNV